VQSFFEGEATSEVGRKGGPGGDLWTAMRPDLTPLDGAITAADRRVQERTDQIAARAERISGATAPPAMRLAVASRLQGAEIARISDAYLKDAPPVDFRVNVNPLVIWLWIGGAIAVAGGLVAIWPAPAARRRRVTDVYAARLARDLGRA
jgi:cytochrome c-type biogenesis protein CcmF